MPVAPAIVPVEVMPPALLLIPPEIEAVELAVKVWVEVSAPLTVVVLPVAPMPTLLALAVPIDTLPVVPVAVPLSILMLPELLVVPVALPDPIVTLLELVEAVEVAGVLTLVPAKPWIVNVPAVVLLVLAAFPIILRAWLAALWIVAVAADPKVKAEPLKVLVLIVPPTVSLLVIATPVPAALKVLVPVVKVLAWFW
jgi:hypothetical protein